MKVNVHIVIILVIGLVRYVYVIQYWLKETKLHYSGHMDQYFQNSHNNRNTVISTDCGKVYTMKTEEMSIKTWSLPNAIYADGKVPVVYKRMQICITLTNILWGSGLCFLSNTLAVALVRPFEQISITSLCIYILYTDMYA